MSNEQVKKDGAKIPFSHEFHFDVKVKRALAFTNISELVGLRNSLCAGALVSDHWSESTRKAYYDLEKAILRTIAAEASETQLFLDDCITDCGNRGEG